MKKSITFVGIILVILIGLTGCDINQNNNDIINNNILENNSLDVLHDHSVEIEGKDMKFLSVKELANLWEIDSKELLNNIIEEFNFKGNYTENTILEEMRIEYKFSPAIIKDIAEKIKNNSKIIE